MTTTRFGGRLLLVGSVWLALTLAAQAQSRDPAPTAQRQALRSTTRHIGVRGFVSFDLNAMAAVDTFDAVLGSARLTALGGGGEVTGLWKGLFVRVDGSSMTKTGSRVLVADVTPVTVTP